MYPISTFELVSSWGPDILIGFAQQPYPGGTSPQEVGTLMRMHLATALVCLGGLVKLARIRT